MAKYNSNILLMVIVVLAIIASGCTGSQDVTPVFKALPEVQQFMNEHPNAKIIVTYWSKEEVTKSVQEISQQCEKPISSVAMYKATVSEGDLKIVSWINAENQTVVCSITQGSGSSQSNTPAPNSNYNSTNGVPITVSTTIVSIASTPIITSTSTPRELSIGALKPILILNISTNLTVQNTPMINNITFEQSTIASSYIGRDAVPNFPEIDISARINKLDSAPVSFWAAQHINFNENGTYTLKLFFKDGSEPKKGDVLIMPIRIINSNGAIVYKTTAFYNWE
jgi:hypothetical protein